MLFASLWRSSYKNWHVTHPLYLNTFEVIEKMEPDKYDLNNITIDFSIIFFQKIALELPVTKKKYIIKTSRIKLGKHVKQNYNAVFSHL